MDWRIDELIDWRINSTASAQCGNISVTLCRICRFVSVNTFFSHANDACEIYVHPRNFLIINTAVTILHAAAEANTQGIRMFPRFQFLVHTLYDSLFHVYAALTLHYKSIMVMCMIFS